MPLCDKSSIIKKYKFFEIYTVNKRVIFNLF